MSHLKSYRLPSFTLTVREVADSERDQATDKQRDYVSVDIRHKSGDKLTVVVGSPVYGDWNEDRAARAAISFASEPSCWDDADERNWSHTHGEDLTTEAYSHSILGKEMRD